MEVSSKHSIENTSTALAVPILNDETSAWLTALFSFLIMIFSVPAVVLNSINVIVFAKLGVTDSITVCFFSLSMVDFSSMVLLSLTAFFTFCLSLAQSWASNFRAYIFVTSIVYSLSIDTASAITAYIALQRGLCVALPFISRHVFTRNRSIVFMAAMFIVMLVSTLPRSVSLELTKAPDPADNSTLVLAVKYLDTWIETNNFYLIFVKTAVVWLEYAIMTAGVIAIAIGMRSSMRLKSHQMKPASTGTDKLGPALNRNRDCGGDSDGGKSGGAGIGTDMVKERGDGERKKATKEANVVKQSLIVVLVHIIFTTPRMISFLLILFDSRFLIWGRYANLIFVLLSAINVTGTINAFVNFFIYLRFNSRFRHTLYSNVRCPGASSLDIKQ